jgi:hypothetical protein
VASDCASQQLIDASNALCGDNTELGKMAAQRVDAHGALLDEQLAGLMQHQHRLLIRALDGHETHIRPGHCLADGRCIDRIILAPF